MSAKRQATLTWSASVIPPKKPKLADPVRNVVNLMPLPPPIMIPPEMIDEGGKDIDDHGRAMIQSDNDEATHDSITLLSDNDNTIDEVDDVSQLLPVHHEPIPISSDEDNTEDESVEMPPSPPHSHGFVCITLSDDDDQDEAESDEMLLPLPNRHKFVCITIDDDEDDEDNEDDEDEAELPDTPPPPYSLFA